MTHVFRPGILCILAAFGLWSSGCASVAQPRAGALLEANRFGELERHMQSQIAAPAAAPFADLYYLCLAHSRTKRYDHLFACADQLQRKTAAGDFMVDKRNLSAAPALLQSQAHMELGDPVRALAEAESAEAQFRVQDAAGQMRLFGRRQLGLAHALTGHPEKARGLAAELEALAFDEDTPWLAREQSLALACLYTALGDFPRALEILLADEEGFGTETYYEKLAEAALAGGGPWTYSKLPRQFLLHHALLKTGDLSAARTGFDKILAMPSVPENRDLHWLALADRGRIAEAEGHLEDALEYYLRAIGVIEQLRFAAHTEAGKVGLIGDRQEVYRRAVELFVSMGDAEGAFEYVERAKARALVELLSGTDAFTPPAAAGGPLAATLAELNRAEKLAAVQDAAPDSAQRLERVARLRRDLLHTAPELAGLLSVQVLKAPDVQSRLNPQETLLEFFYHGDHLFAFVLDKDMLHMQRLDGTGLQKEVRAFRTALRSPKSTNYLELGRRLYLRLIAPVAAHLKKPLVTLVPHGTLHYLPFNALYTGERHFVENFNLRLLSSASVMAYLRAPVPTAFTSALVVGNPSGDLKFAEAEARRVGKLAASAELLLEHQATETRFKEAADRFAYLHLATHGRLRSDAPLQSGLQLEADAANDGLLKISELYTLRLNARLVTLSACEAARDEAADGDDVVGLTRGFLYAGAQSLIAGLWSVDDRATGELMETFYRNLEKAPLGLALRQAQLAVRSQYPHPYYWAAFQLTGQFQYPPPPGGGGPKVSLRSHPLRDEAKRSARCPSVIGCSAHRRQVQRVSTLKTSPR